MGLAIGVIDTVDMTDANETESVFSSLLSPMEPELELPSPTPAPVTSPRSRRPDQGLAQTETPPHSE